MYPPILRVHLKKRSAEDLSNENWRLTVFAKGSCQFLVKEYAMFLCVFYSDFLYKAYVVGTHLNCIHLSMQFKWVPTTYMPL